MVRMMRRRRPVTLRMETLLREWETTADRRAIFLRCYLLMTHNMLAAVEDGAFRDCDWVHALLHRFADYYFEALSTYEQDVDQAPPVWRRVHDVARREEALVVQDLLLGVNAHINYDLVLTLVDMLEPEWAHLSTPERHARYADHCRINHIIGATIDAVQDHVIETVAPEMNVVDTFLGRLDEWLISQLITRWRDEVWQHAVEMLVRPEPQRRERARFEIESLTQRRARAILLKDGVGHLSHLW